MRFALAGNPNSGKTTLFNSLTGSTAKVGNWPGVTVAHREGKFRDKDVTQNQESIIIIDLPGIYSLSPYTPEEVVTRNFILEEKPDVIINIVDATNLERNLYLTTQLLETNTPIILALNMSDLLKKDGIEIDLPKLEKSIGVPIVLISALRNEGVKELMKKAIEISKSKRNAFSVITKKLMSDTNENFSECTAEIENLLINSNTKHSTFRSVKIIEGDNLFNSELDENLIKRCNQIKDKIILAKEFDNDFEAAVADHRYKYIVEIYKKSFKHTNSSNKMTNSDKIDTVLTNKWFGIPIFLLIMFLIFHLTFSENLLFVTGLPSPGVLLATLVESVVELITNGLSNFLLSINVLETSWVYGLLINGVLAGVGAVFGFLPYILLLYLFLSIMEDSGYMARAAFLMDKLFVSLGLSGKAFIPLLMGFGCSVPAITATRTLENEKERKITIMMMTGFSCGAKLPIWTIFAAAFFPQYADLMVFGIYVIGIIVMMIAAFFLKRTFMKGDIAPFIMELPDYRLPQLKNLFLTLSDKLKDFVLRTTTIIAGATIVIWFLSNFNIFLQMVEENSRNSILGSLGSFLRPIFIPLGFASDAENGWKAIVAIITGLIAKEMVVATMGVLYPTSGVGGDVISDESAKMALISQLGIVFTPLSALSFMVFNLLCVPCMAAVASAQMELKSGKAMFYIISFWLVIAYISALIIYQGGNAIMFVLRMFGF